MKVEVGDWGRQDIYHHLTWALLIDCGGIIAMLHQCQVPTYYCLTVSNIDQ